jgi:ribonuclease HI
VKRVIIYTDGACLGNPGKGGWAAIMKYEDNYKTISGSEQDTTNNRMELMAAIQALEHLRQPCEVDIHTDSQYLKNGITTWIHKWKKIGWKNIKNIDLWQRLDANNSQHKVHWHWVKSHSGVKYNDEVDKLAVKAAKELNND